MCVWTNTFSTLLTMAYTLFMLCTPVLRVHDFWTLGSGSGLGFPENHTRVRVRVPGSWNLKKSGFWVRVQNRVRSGFHLWNLQTEIYTNTHWFTNITTNSISFNYNRAKFVTYCIEIKTFSKINMLNTYHPWLSCSYF
jgi:hypothetical protein